MTVTLSRTTLDVLKNYATINSSIVFRKGNRLRTISNAENILSQFTSEEIFPTDFAIYDLSQFLNGIGNLYHDGNVLAVAKAFQEATDWHKKYPPKFDIID